MPFVNVSIPVLPFYDPSTLKLKIDSLDERYDLIFIDGAGESIARGITAFIIAISDINIIPQKLGTKDLSAYLNKFLPIIKNAKNLKIKSQYHILASHVSPVVNPENVYLFLQG